jgi:hypothetical protein
MPLESVWFFWVKLHKLELFVQVNILHQNLDCQGARDVMSPHHSVESACNCSLPSAAGMHCLDQVRCKFYQAFLV